MKAAWFIGGKGWTEISRAFDVGKDGTERLRTEVLHGRFENGPETLYTARYHTVRGHDLLVYVYDMHLDGAHLSTSLATAAFEADGGKTKLTYTEQAVYLDGEDGSISRRSGVGAQFDRLADQLAGKGETR